MTDATFTDYTKINTPTIGTGPLSFGAAVLGFRGVEALLDGATYGYSIQQSDGEFEVGSGTYALAGNTLTRGVLHSSNDGDPISLNGQAVVTFTVLARDLSTGLSTGVFPLPYGQTARSSQERFQLNILDYKGAIFGMVTDRDAMRAMMRQAAGVSVPGLTAPKRMYLPAQGGSLPGGDYDFGDGDLCSGLPGGKLSASDFVIFGDVNATRVQITGTNSTTKGQLFNLSGCSSFYVGGFDVFCPNGLDWSAGADALFSLQGCFNGYVDQMVLTNIPALLRLGDVLASNKNSFSRIIAGGWRSSLNLDYIRLGSGATFRAANLQLNSETLAGAGCFFRLAPVTTQDTIPKTGFDTWLLDECILQNSGGSAGNTHNPVGMLLDCTNGPIYNGRVVKSENDHALTALLIQSLGGAYGAHNNKFLQSRFTADGGASVHLNWQAVNLGGGLYGDFTGNSMVDPVLIYTSDTPGYLVEPVADPTVTFEGLPLIGSHLVSGWITGNSPAPAPCAWRAGAPFSMDQVTFGRIDVATRNVDHFGETTGNFAYSITGCKLKAFNDYTIHHDPSEQRWTSDKVVTNNIGLSPSEDTALHMLFATVAACTGYRTESVALFSYLQGLGVPPSSSDRTRYDAFIGALIDAGIWALGRQSVFLVGPNRTASKVDLFNLSTNPLLEFFNPTWSGPYGYWQGDGAASYLAATLTPANLGLTQDGMSAFVWNGNDVAANGAYAIGGSTGAVFRINPRDVAGHPQMQANCSTVVGTLSPPTSVGLFGWARSASDSWVEFAQGGEAAHADPSTGLASALLFLHTAAVYDSVHHVRGGGLWPYLDGTKRAALNAAFAAYMAL